MSSSTGSTSFPSSATSFESMLQKMRITQHHTNERIHHHATRLQQLHHAIQQTPPSHPQFIALTEHIAETQVALEEAKAKKAKLEEGWRRILGQRQQQQMRQNAVMAQQRSMQASSQQQQQQQQQQHSGEMSHVELQEALRKQIEKNKMTSKQLLMHQLLTKELQHQRESTSSSAAVAVDAGAAATYADIKKEHVEQGRTPSAPFNPGTVATRTRRGTISGKGEKGLSGPKVVAKPRLGDPVGDAEPALTVSETKLSDIVRQTVASYPSPIEVDADIQQV